MAFGQVDNDQWCVGGSTATHSFTMSGSADVLVVTVAGYRSGAGTGNFSVDWGDGTTWNALTLPAGGETLNTGALVAIFYIISPDTSDDTIRVNLTGSWTEGVTATAATYSAAGTVTLVDAGSDMKYSNNQTATDTLTGGASGDQIYVGGADWSGGATLAFDLTQQSQTTIQAPEETTACQSNHYGHAEKDWASGATCDVDGDYPYMGCIAFNDDGAAASGNPWYYYAQN